MPSPIASPALRLGLTALAMAAFAGNSLLCRTALRETAIDPATFTTVRLLSGGVALALLVGRRGLWRGSWGSAVALFAYAAGFSFSYRTLSAGTGALLLFGAVQVTMIGHGLARGERLSGRQTFGLLLATGGLVGLLLPGATAPPWLGSAWMLGAGVAWGIYSLRGRTSTDEPTVATAANFVRASCLALPLSALLAGGISLDPAGLGLAVASGALTSGLGYVIWYTVLPSLEATDAATVQLSVPVLAAVGGTLLLGEVISLRLVLASVATLGGIALVLRARLRRPPTAIARPLDR